MRLIPLLLIAAALVMAGCAKKADNSGDGGTTTPPTTTTGGTTTTSPTTTTPSGTTPTTPTGNTTTTTPTVVTPKDIATGTQSFDPSVDNPATPLAAKAYTVDPGYTTLTLNVTFSCLQSAPACVIANGESLVASGLTCSTAAGPQTADLKCTKTGAATAGPGKLNFNGGPDPVQATYKLTES